MPTPKPTKVGTSYVVMCCAHAHPSNHYFDCEPDSIWLTKSHAERYVATDPDVQAWKEKHLDGGFFIDDLEVLGYGPDS